MKIATFFALFCLAFANAFSQETKEVIKTIPAAEAPPSPAPEARVLPASEDPEKLFQKGFDLGRVGDRPSGHHRRLVQRTLMIGENQQAHGVILTFDDQIIPTDRGHSSALDIMKDLQSRGTRAIFFANVPAVSEKSLLSIDRSKLTLDQKKERCQKLLDGQREQFVKGIRALVRLKKDDQYLCEVFNHTAFHQNMGSMKKGTARFEMCLLGIRFIESCLDEAYAAERPGTQRMRYFRFPFLQEPRNSETQAELDRVFTELGLISLGETSDSKDYSNSSPTHAYKSLKAAQNGQRYDIKTGPYGVAESPIALFHTKTWSQIRSGVLKFLDESPKESSPETTPDLSKPEN